MFRVVLTMLVLVVAGLVLAPAVHACSLAGPAPGDEERFAEMRLRSADVAIYGVVLSVRVPEAPAAAGPQRVGQRFEAKVRVTRVFKGRTSRVVRVRGNTDEASCGIGELRVGERLGLLLDRPSRPFRVGLSSRITLKELLSATRGKWRKPV